MVIQAFKILDTFSFFGYEVKLKTKEEIKVELFCKISSNIVRILDNEHITPETHLIITNHIYNPDRALGLPKLLLKAAMKEINDQEIVMLIGLLPLIDKIPENLRRIVLHHIVQSIKEHTKSDNVSGVIQLPNKQLLLIALTKLLRQTDIQKKSSNTPKFSNESQLQLSAQSIQELMGFCLQAVTNFFDDLKNFEGTVIYLKFALKLFVCVGVEGATTILGDRSLQDFVLYFIIKSVTSNKITNTQLAIFLDMYIDSVSMLIRSPHTSDNDFEIVKQAFDVFALFTNEYRGQNEELYNMLIAQIEPNKIKRHKTQDGSTRDLKQTTIDFTMSTQSLYKQKSQTINDFNQIDKFYYTLQEQKFDQIFIQSALKLVIIEIEVASMYLEISTNSPQTQAKRLTQKESIKFINQLIKHFLESERDLKEKLGMLLQFLQTAIQVLKQIKCHSFSFFKQNILMITQKVFQHINEFLNDNKVEVFEKLIEFLFLEFSNVIITSSSFQQQAEEYGNFLQNFIIDPVTKSLKRIEFMNLYTKTFKVITKVIKKCHKFSDSIRENGETISSQAVRSFLCEDDNISKVLWTMLLLLQFQNTETNINMLNQYVEMNTGRRRNETTDFNDNLNCIYEMLVKMGAPYCFNDNKDKASDYRNSQEVITLWAIIMIFIQRRPDSQPFLAASINKIACVSSCILYDQDFIMKIKTTAYYHRDLQQLLNEKRKAYEKYPQLIKSLENSLIGANLVVKEKPVQPEKQNKLEILKKFKQLKLQKSSQDSLKLQPQQVVVEDPNMVQQQVIEEVSESLISSQQLNSNELLFLEMFILMNESRISYLRTMVVKNGQYNTHCSSLVSDCKMQNFIQSILMHFNNTSIDIENLQQKLEGIIKVLVPEYLNDLKNYVQVDSGLENLINQDIVFLLKTRIHANKNLQNLSTFILRKYLEAFPLQLQIFEVFQVYMDCIQLLSEELDEEYTSLVKPQILKTIKEYVFIPSDHNKVELILLQLVSTFTELFIYSSIYNQRTLNQAFIKYKSLYESCNEGKTSTFHIKLFQSLEKNFTLTRLRAYTEKNLFEIQTFMIAAPQSIIADVQVLKNEEPNFGVFFSKTMQERVFNLQMIKSKSIQDQSLVKMQPFPIRIPVGSVEPDKALVDLQIIHQQVESQLEVLLISSPFQSQEQVLSSMLLELKAKLLKQVMKIDIVGQLQFIHKNVPTIYLLTEVTKRILDIHQQEIDSSGQGDVSPVHFKLPKDDQEQSDSQPACQEIKTLKMISKILMKFDKKQYIEKLASKMFQIASQMQVILFKTKGSPNSKLTLMLFIINSICQNLEPSSVKVLQSLFENFPELKEVFTDHSRLLVDLIAQKFTVTKKSLKSKQKQISQCVISNFMVETLLQMQPKEQVEALLQMIMQYDFHMLEKKYPGSVSPFGKLDDSFVKTMVDEQETDQGHMLCFKQACSYQQQVNSSKILYFVQEWTTMINFTYSTVKQTPNSFRTRLTLCESFARFIDGTGIAILKLSHKEKCLPTCLNMVKLGLSMIEFERKLQKETKPKQLQVIKHLLEGCMTLLIKLCIHQKNMKFNRESQQALRDELQLIEDVKYLLLKSNSKDVGQKAYLINKHSVYSSLTTPNLYMFSRHEFHNLAVRKRFCQIVGSKKSNLIVSIKAKYLNLFLEKQNDEFQGTLVTNILYDNLNQIRYSLMGNNFSPKMMEAHIRPAPLASNQLIREKFHLLLLSSPDLIETSTHISESLQAIIHQILAKQFSNDKHCQNILSKVFWKSERVLGIMFKGATDTKNLQLEQRFLKMMSLWRNQNVAKMVKFLGFKYQGNYFLHSVALKPFYASPSKIVIFYLSQFFQSLRWDTNYQIHRWLVKKSHTMPSIAHNVIWFCRVESFVDAQPHRKVPLPIIENLDQHSNLLIKLIMIKMTDEERKYFETETSFLEKITSISGVLTPSQSKDEKKAIIREKLIQYNKEIPPSVYLPTDQKCRIVGIVTTSGQPMQSAARVPILVSFEVQEYEGPDNDPLLNRQIGQVQKQINLLPKKQYRQLSQAIKLLSFSLLKLNAISFDADLANNKLNEELKDQIMQQQLTNYQNSTESLLELIAKYKNTTSNNFQKTIKKSKEDTFRWHIAQLNNQPTLKIKMSQYAFQTKTMPILADDQPFSGIIKNRPRKIFTNERVTNHNTPQIPQSGFKIKKKLGRIEESPGVFSEEKEDSDFEQAPLDIIKKISPQKTSPAKVSQRRLTEKKRTRSFSQRKRLSISMKNLQGKSGSAASQFNYRPSLVYKQKSSNSINLVLQFEQQMIHAQQKITNQLQNAIRSRMISINSSPVRLEQRAITIASNEEDVNSSAGPIRDETKPIKIVSCIFKVNDDLRQDILALQFIKLFQKIFKKSGLDLFVAPYKCISNRTGNEQLLGGIIEVVPNSNSRDQIGKAFEIDLYDYFLKKYGNESSKAFMTARLNFIKSLAAYSVVSFILQIKDRHNGNILINDQGSIVHIDFGFIFDWSPGKDMRFESANFKMTKEFIKILGGNAAAEPYQLWVKKTIQGYLAVRQHYREFMNLVELMIYSGFPCFKQVSLQTLQSRFRMEGEQKCLNQFEAALFMRSVIEDAHDKWTTTAYDMIQYKQNKIVF